MELTAKLNRLEQTFKGVFLIFEIQERDLAQQCVDELSDKELTVTVKRKVKRRSLSANAYAWKLIGLISDKLRNSKEETYIEMLKRYGQILEDEKGQPLVFSVRSDIDVTSLYKYIDIIGHGNVNGKPFTHYRALKGTSEFTTEEMSIFIDGVISEAKELGIETLPPEELARMKEDWK